MNFGQPRRIAMSRHSVDIKANSFRRPRNPIIPVSLLIRSRRRFPGAAPPRISLRRPTLQNARVNARYSPSFHFPRCGLQIYILDSAAKANPFPRDYYLSPSVRRLPESTHSRKGNDDDDDDDDGDRREEPNEVGLKIRS